MVSTVSPNNLCKKKINYFSKSNIKYLGGRGEEELDLRLDLIVQIHKDLSQTSPTFYTVECYRFRQLA